MGGLYVSSHISNGLGNNLFQIAAAYGISNRDNKVPVFEFDNTYRQHSSIEIYVDNIFRNLIFVNKLTNFLTYNEINFEYNEIPKIDQNLKIFGYFQSEKYFYNCKEEILKIFDIDETNKKYLETKYNSVLDKDTCSLHIRRGDYLKSNGAHPIIDLNYYKNALLNFNKDTTYLIFSDDINWCKQNFNFLQNKIFIENSKDYQDLYLMSLCNNNIIANSTFSWWGAWLNKNKNKKIIAPLNWFGANRNHNTKDLYCKNWIVI
jgi:hypothetical protein